MMKLLKQLIKQEEGQDLVEYALLLVFLALAAITVLSTLGSSIKKVFSQSNSALNTGWTAYLSLVNYKLWLLIRSRAEVWLRSRLKRNE